MPRAIPTSWSFTRSEERRVGKDAKATGLEALFGRLYLEGKTERINALFCLGLEGGESHGL